MLKTRFGRFVRCGVTVCVVALLAGCTESDSKPIPSPGAVASSSEPSKTASPTPSAEVVTLLGAERAVARFWRVIDRLSADPDSDLTELTTVSRGSVAAQWAKNINQYRFDQVKAEGRVVVRDVMAQQSKDDDLYRVTACIDASKVNLVT